MPGLVLQRRGGISQLLHEGEVELFLFSQRAHGLLPVGGGGGAGSEPGLAHHGPFDLRPERSKLSFGGVFPSCGAANCHPHRGDLFKAELGCIYKLWEGCAAVTFELPIMLGVRGESSLFFNVTGKGLFCLAGCSYQGPLSLYNRAGLGATLSASWSGASKTLSVLCRSTLPATLASPSSARSRPLGSPRSSWPGRGIRS